MWWSVCLGVGLGMLAGTSGCQPRACWEERTVAGYMCFEKDSGASRPAPLQGGRRKGTTVCWSLPFLCQNISTKKIQRNGIPSPHTCFFCLTMVRHKQSRSANLESKLKLPTCCMVCPIHLSSSGVLCRGGHTKWRKGSTETWGW